MNFNLPTSRINKFKDIISFFENNNESFKDKIYDLYVNQLKTYRQLVIILGVNNRTIKKILDHYKIPIRHGSEAIKIQWINNDKRREEQSISFGNRIRGKDSIRRTPLDEIKKCAKIYNYTFLKRYKMEEKTNFTIELKCNNCSSVSYFKGVSSVNKKCCIFHKGKRVTSSGEIKVCEYLKRNGIDFEMEVSFKDLYYKEKNKYLRFDFAIYSNSKLLFLIEYDGIQHFKENSYFSDFKDRKTRDILKDDYCRNNSIKLIRVPYYHDDRLEEFFDYYLKG